MKTFAHMRRGWTATILLAATAALASCGGGGNGGGGAANATLIEITVQGVSEPLFANGQQVQTSTPGGVLLNSRVTFTFAGPVDPTSLPGGGVASGSINITNIANAVPAQGTFQVNPANPNQVFFTALPPLNPTAPCQAGLEPISTYSIFLPTNAGGNQQVVVVGGAPLAQPVGQVTFSVVDCDPMNPGPSLADSFPGNPMIVAMTPQAGPGAPTVTQAQIAGPPGTSRIVIDVNEPILPASVTIDSVKILNTTSNATLDIPVGLQIGTGVVLQQFGTIPGQNVARIQITTGVPLPDGFVYEIQLAVTDLGGNMIESPQLLFTVQDNNDDQMFTFFDDFSTTTNRGEVLNNIAFNGDGIITATFPIEIIGNGDDGVGSFTTGSSIVINTDNFVSGGISVMDGAFNFTQLTIGTGSPLTLSFTATSNDPAANPGSTWAAKLRSTSTISVANFVTITAEGRAGNGVTVINTAPTASILGGWGGPGGGRGGTASQINGGMPTPQAESGDGGRVLLTDPTRPGNQTNEDPNNPLFGGGEGGRMAVSTVVPASGGGGGSASSFMGPQPVPQWTFSTSQDGQPGSAAAGVPAPGMRGPFPPAMIPPLQGPIGGSGGGGGGDRLLGVSETTGTGGGGGGGSLRISSAGNITFGNFIVLKANGGAGGNTSVTSIALGKGGGGSGGTIIVQTFNTITFGPGPVLNAAGGNGGTGQSVSPPNAADGGRGGDGVVQLEDTNIATLLTFLMNNAAISGQVFTSEFVFTSGIGGIVRSTIIDTGSAGVDYLSASAVTDPGDSGTIEVQVLGIAPDPTNPNQPASTDMDALGNPLMVGPVPLSQIDMLDGFRFFRYIVTTGFPPPPATTLMSALPTADEITVTYER